MGAALPKTILEVDQIMKSEFEGIHAEFKHFVVVGFE
jgi:hypothetical protein